MITFILPGYSPKNKEWLEKTTESLKNLPGFIRPISWDHWSDPDQKFNAMEKAELIARHTKGDSINIVAKSIGTLVASYIIEKIPNQINKVILCGIPLNDINDTEKESIKKAVLSMDREKVVCIQNRGDPHGTYSQVVDLFEDQIEIVSKPREDHDYPYFTILKFPLD